MANDEFAIRQIVVEALVGDISSLYKPNSGPYKNTREIYQNPIGTTFQGHVPSDLSTTRSVLLPKNSTIS